MIPRRPIERVEIVAVWSPTVYATYYREGWNADPEHPEPPENEPMLSSQTFYVRLVAGERELRLVESNPEAAGRFVAGEIKVALASLVEPEAGLVGFLEEHFAIAIAQATAKSRWTP